MTSTRHPHHAGSAQCLADHRRPPIELELKVLTDPHTLDSSRPVDPDSLAYPLTGAPPEHPSDTPEDFSRGIQHLVGGVTVVTSADSHGERSGLTTSSVCTLSMDPPTLVACIARGSELGRNLGRTRQFCVNVLSQQHRPIAEVFAGPSRVEGDKFQEGRWVPGWTGSPVLADALASFECSIDLVYGYPSHLMVVGSVVNAVHTADARDPLVFTGPPAGAIP